MDVEHISVLPGNGSVVLCEVYKMYCKRHGAHSEHVHNSERRKPHLHRQAHVNAFTDENEMSGTQFSCIVIS